MRSRRAIPIAVPALGDDEWEALREPLESGWLTQGPVVARFESQFAERHRVRHALATTSCTTALHLALLALDVGPGDEVIVPGFTWVATANVVVLCGATPVFVDVDRDTYNLDPARVAERVTERTRAVMAVHLFGLCADVDAIRAALPAGVAVIEDAACAAGAAYRGVPAGGLGEVAAFSFHPRKSVTTGEGGMLTTGDDDVADRVGRLRSHGAGVPEEVRHNGPAPHLLPSFDELGFNYRMTDLQAAVGCVQLGKLDDFIAERDSLAERYTSALAEIPWLAPPPVPAGYDHAWQSYVTRVGPDAPVGRDDLMGRLHEAGVSTRPGTHAVTELGYYVGRDDPGRADCPVAAELEATTMALPLHNRMTADDADYVIEAIVEAAG